MSDRRLKVVDPASAAPRQGKLPEEPKTVVEAVRSGSRVELLFAMGVRVAAVIDDEGTAPRDMAALTKRMGDISAELNKLVSGGQPDSSAEDVPFDVSAI